MYLGDLVASQYKRVSVWKGIYLLIGSLDMVVGGGGGRYC